MGGPEHQDRAAAEYPREDRSFRLYRANRAAAGHGKRGILLGLGDKMTRRGGVSIVPAAARWKCHASGTKRYT